MNNTTFAREIWRDVAPQIIQEQLETDRHSSFSCTLSQSVTYPSSGYNDILGMIAGVNNVKLLSGTIFLETIKSYTPTELPEKIAQYLKQKKEIESSDYDYKTFTIYVNSDISELRLSGYKELNNNSLQTLFSTLRHNINTENGDFPGSPELAVDKIFLKEDENILVYVSNYYTTAHPSRNSSVNYLAGRNFKNAREQVLLALCPAYFPTLKARLNETELDIFKKLTNIYNFNTPALAERIGALTASPKYLNALKPKLMERFKATLKRNKTLLLLQHETELLNDIESTTDRIQSLESELHNVRKNILVAQNTTVAESDEDAEYLFTHPYILTARATRDDIIELTARLPLSAWDENVAKTIIENIDSIFRQSDVTNAMYKSLIRTFLQHVFIDQDVTYWINSTISFGAVQSARFSIRNHSNIWSSDFISNCKSTQSGFNPHLEFYGCVGSHEANILKALRTKNIPLIIEALFAPLKNWNLTDSAVLSRALREMFPLLIDKDIECLEDGDGNMITLKQLYEFDAKKREAMAAREEAEPFTNADPLVNEETDIETFTEED